MPNTLTIPRNDKGRALRAPAGTTNQRTDYPITNGPSRGESLARAADVLLLLVCCPLSATLRAAYTALLERRLRRVYQEVAR